MRMAMEKTFLPVMLLNFSRLAGDSSYNNFHNDFKILPVCSNSSFQIPMDDVDTTGTYVPERSKSTFISQLQIDIGTI